jgi:hypothetical protein
VIGAIALAFRLIIEISIGCHCLSWTTTPHGARCTAPLDHPRCELIPIGWHPISFGVNTCSKGCDE